MIRYYIECDQDIIGFNGRVTKQSENIDSYLKAYGFATAESAGETARELGLMDGKIHYINLK